MRYIVDVFSYEEMYIYYESKKYICHRTTFCSIFNMSSCRKPELQMICLKSSEFPKNKLTNRGQKSLTMFISSCFNNYSIEFKKKMKFKKIESAIPTVWGYGTPAQYQYR